MICAAGQTKRYADAEKYFKMFEVHGLEAVESTYTEMMRAALTCGKYVESHACPPKQTQRSFFVRYSRLYSLVTVATQGARLRDAE